MTDRTYRAVLGLVLILSLYFDLDWLMYSLIALLFFEGITDLRVSRFVYELRSSIGAGAIQYENSELVDFSRFNIESERVWRILVGGFLLVSYAMVDALWFFPWFMGFAVFGAGLSGICPVLLAVRWAGFK